MITLGNALLVKDPALACRWWVQVPTDTVSSPFECIAENIEISFAKTPAKGRHFQGTQRFYPDIRDIDSVTITFYETFDHQVGKWLQRWRSKINRDDGSYGYPVDYKKDILAHMYRLDANEPVLTYKLEGAWPTDRATITMNYDDEVARVQVISVFSIDKNTQIEV